MLSEMSYPNTSTLRTKQNSSNCFEIRALIALLILTNLGLLLGNTPAAELMFQPKAVAAGEWWRLLSWPFVHVSRYHLILDGTAFLLIYSSLKEKRPIYRVACTLAVFIGSLLLPIIISPQISQVGLCGLSGPAHGLIAISALEMRQNSSERTIGSLLLCALCLKTGWELYTGLAFLQQLHFGNIGQPIVATHAGGLIAGLSSYQLRNFWRKNPVP